ncbi:MAG: DUF4129 domain-containing protein [Tannerella sp.]|nr:DUF4129 domain-containing protein [Tannerella sp.]
MTQLLDPFACDTAKIAAYQADRHFDYNSQLNAPDYSLLEIFGRWLARQLSRFFGNELAEDISFWLLIVFFVAVVAAAARFVYKKRPELFLREKKRPLTYEMEEENIYRIDFDGELAVALAAGDFRAAVRLLYLQTLRFAADREWIEWQIYKTPTEYVYELQPARLRASFRDLTNRFLQVRYGNFKATREWFDAMRSLQDTFRKGGLHETVGE